VIELFPRGWFDQEFVNYNRVFDEMIIPALDVAARRIHPQASAKAQERFARSAAGPANAIFRHEVTARLLLPAISNVLVKSANAQACVDLARIACALERYRLAETRYPETLDALVPRYLTALPRDVITGDPPRYHRPDNDRFVLYSVGWNETDDRGAVATVKPSSARSELREGDWVWTYPATKP
jgi:hypothetical protein